MDRTALPASLNVALLGRETYRWRRLLVDHLKTRCSVEKLDDGCEAFGTGARRLDVLITSRFSKAEAERFPGLRLLQIDGAGFEDVDLDAVSPGTTVANAYGHGDAIGEFVLLQMMALSRQLCARDRAMRAGDWRGNAETAGLPRQLKGKTVGVLGLGEIGRNVARRCRVFGMKVMALRRRPGPAIKDKLQLDFLGGLQHLRHVLRRSDYVVIALPLTGETQQLIGARELATMKPTSYLINVARSGIVDETALYGALKQGRIAGAAVDVWPQESLGGSGIMPSRLPFQDLPNVVMTPHIAAVTEEAMDRRWRQIAAQIDRLAAGRPLRHVIKRHIIIPGR